MPAVQIPLKCGHFATIVVDEPAPYSVGVPTRWLCFHCRESGRITAGPIVVEVGWPEP